MDQSQTDDFERRVQELDERLDIVNQQNEASRLQAEITFLEQKLLKMEQQSSLAYSRYRQNEHRHSPGAGFKTSTPVYDTPMKHNGAYTLPFVSPIKTETSNDGDVPDQSTRPKQVTFRSNSPVGQKQDSVESRSSVGPSQGVKVKPATYDGTGSWNDYIAHFEACAKINNWTDSNKGLYLAVSLRGQAQGVLGNLSDQTNDFQALSTALQQRFAPPNQTELYRCQLRDRRQKASESLAELAQDIRRLTNLAHPSAPSDVKETLSKEQFVDSLHSSDIRLKVKQARPSNLNYAVHHAIELEAYYRAEQKKVADTGILYSATSPETDSGADEIKELKSAVTTLQNEFRAWTKKSEGQFIHRNRHYEDRARQRSGTKQYTGYENKNRTGTIGPRKCYECGSERHLIADCPKRKSQPNQNKNGGQRRFEFRNKGWKAKQKSKFSETEAHEKNDGTVNSSGFKCSGLYISGQLAGREVNCLVDTGATLTLISSKVWNNICDDTRQLWQFDRKLVSASGDFMSIQGKARVDLEIAGTKFHCDVVVGNIAEDVILGLDFLKKEGGKLDIENNTLTIQGTSLKLNCTGTLGCYRVVVSERTEIPARSETIVKGNIEANKFRPGELCLIEPIEKSYQSGGSMVAKCLVQGNSGIPVRVLNPTCETKILYPGTHVATASQVCGVLSQDRISFQIHVSRGHRA